jgi:hypothetical protein
MSVTERHSTRRRRGTRPAVTWVLHPCLVGRRVGAFPRGMERGVRAISIAFGYKLAVSAAAAGPAQGRGKELGHEHAVLIARQNGLVLAGLAKLKCKGVPGLRACGATG